MSGVRIRSCPACGHHVAVPFFDGGDQPLATIAWPESAAQARDLPRLPLDFVQCVRCTHIHNAAFDYGHVPYSSKPNLMFNRAAAWSEFIRGLQERILAPLAPAERRQFVGFLRRIADGNNDESRAPHRP